MGYCSVTHLDMILEKLQTASKPAEKKSSGGFFSSKPKVKNHREFILRTIYNSIYNAKI